MLLNLQKVTLNNFFLSYSSGLSIIISSPSGAGKSTITRAILKKIKKSHLSISFTTRKPRSNERDGVDYFFVSKEKFINLKKRKKFLEFAKVYENYYGTLKSEVKNNLKKKILVFLNHYYRSKLIQQLSKLTVLVLKSIPTMH